MSNPIYRQQTAETVSPFPKVLRTFRQYLYCLGYAHQQQRTRINDRTWLTDAEHNSYLAGITDAMQDGHSDYHC